MCPRNRAWPVVPDSPETPGLLRATCIPWDFASKNGRQHCFISNDTIIWIFMVVILYDGNGLSDLVTNNAYIYDIMIWYYEILSDLVIWRFHNGGYNDVMKIFIPAKPPSNFWCGCRLPWHVKNSCPPVRMVEVIVAHLNREKCRREDQNKDPGG